MTRKHPQSHAAHMARYGWALPYCYKQTVLDAGGGQGFGAHLLSQVANRILLTDVSQVLLNDANKWHNYFCPVDSVQCDLEKDFPASTDGFDTIVAFEVIEHLENPEFFIENVAKALKKGGRLLFSVPYMMSAEGHKQLFNKKSIYELVSKHLRVDQLFEQDKNLDGTHMKDWKGRTDIFCLVGVATKI